MGPPDAALEPAQPAQPPSRPDIFSIRRSPRRPPARAHCARAAARQDTERYSPPLSNALEGARRRGLLAGAAAAAADALLPAEQPRRAAGTLRRHTFSQLPTCRSAPPPLCYLTPSLVLHRRLACKHLILAGPSPARPHSSLLPPCPRQHSPPTNKSLPPHTVLLAAL